VREEFEQREGASKKGHRRLAANYGAGDVVVDGAVVVGVGGLEAGRADGSCAISPKSLHTVEAKSVANLRYDP